ncbi:snake venom serine protease 2C-like [Anopheles aquasalis]|uniref:snake venom serine protease 2C-like n=1 Tax=Anopheles aquasalis TaxID=42839 RepID=UPI00215B2144|nr:snake venom serine protease 2C-like [Anopheles aquasalis]
MVGIHSMICCFTKLKRDKVEHYVPKSCGQKPTTDNSPFGWTVLLGTGHFYRRCVGTLINSVFVLTAAHCVNEVEPHEITLYFGQVPVRELPQCLEHDHCLKASGLQLWKHPGFNSSTNIFNVAVIETNLNKDSILRYPNIGIYPICLPLNATDEDTQIEKRHILRPRIYDTTNGIQEACGYSGAPIVVLDNEKRYHVVGVANHPVDCDRKRVKRDATPLMEYVDWILSVLPEGREEPETIKD